MTVADAIELPAGAGFRRPPPVGLSGLDILRAVPGRLTRHRRCARQGLPVAG